ncbi:hypothetical protein LG634_07340 [Streptomyces bambusae]|uniref:hypothetical protein n=1 Tax=Streptomyces bambusae TaxID=1550616 RepID=UPI001CFCF501|nr:hypothetical protein [Streptomyces bambusae]MCB5164646.1 hypothetical protein [Streptomyces bambusae]
MHRSRARATVLAGVAAVLLGAAPSARAATPAPAVAAAAPSATAATALTGPVVHSLPGLGPGMRALIPRQARQVLLVSGASADSDRSTEALYERGPAGWVRTAGPWPAHNGKLGWTRHHRLGDLRSPSGVFGLTDAGGWLPDPGSLLPYHGSALFRTDRVFDGRSLRNAFGLVVAVDYNRTPGTSPLDRSRPLGAARGGGIWLHVDSDAPTQGCISVSLPHMEELLRLLDPAAHPVVVMGDGPDLAR